MVAWRSQSRSINHQYPTVGEDIREGLIIVKVLNFSITVLGNKKNKGIEKESK